MAKAILSDSLWERILPLLPGPKPRRTRYPGRKPIDDRKALTGILFVLKAGIPWEFLPQEMGCGSGMTCWRRLRDWQQAGAWEQVRAILEPELGPPGTIDWERVEAGGAAAARGPDEAEGTGPGGGGGGSGRVAKRARPAARSPRRSFTSGGRQAPPFIAS